MTAASLLVPLVTAGAVGTVAWATARWWGSAAWGLAAGPVLWLWITVVSTELWALPRLVGPVTVVGTQLAVAAVALVSARRRPPVWASGQHPRPGTWLWVWLVLTAVLLVTVLSTAPNNLDSLAYHLVKADQWWAQGSLDHVPTPYPAQVYLGPAAEVGVLHLLVDSRGLIPLAGLVQLTAHVGCAAGAWVIAGNLGADRDVRGLAALLATSAPVAVAQAVTTQNDYVVALTLVTAVAAVTDRQRGRPLDRVLVLGAATGVGIATKATAVLFLWPVAVWALWALRREGARRLAALVVVAGTLVCVPNLGWTARNAVTFGSALGPPSALTVDSTGPGGALVNLVRNAGHAVGTPVTAVNDTVGSLVGSALTAVGADVDDPAWLYGADAWAVDAQRNEDRAPWAVQAVLLLLVLGALLTPRLRPTARTVLPLLAVVAVGYVGFSAVLRWQPWGGRLLLPLVVLSGVPIALVLGRLSRPWQVVAVGCVLLQAVPWVFLSTWRPLVGERSTLRTSASAELFAATPELEEPLTAAVAHVLASHPDAVALGENTYPVEYQVRWLARRATPVDVAFVHTDPEPFTAALAERPEPRVGLCLCDNAPVGAHTERFGPVLTWSTEAP